jgi:hypothetical protein
VLVVAVVKTVGIWHRSEIKINRMKKPSGQIRTEGFLILKRAIKN